MVVALLLLAGGLILLAVAADQFVVGAARLARALSIPAVVVGVVVVGFGTSLPEGLVSGLAAGRGEVATAVGNIVGSNIASLTLLLGIGALLTPIAVASEVVRREIPLVALATVMIAVAVQGELTATRGLLLAAGMVAALAVSLVSAWRARGTDPLGAETDELVDGDRSRRLAPEVLRTVVGLGLTLLAAQLTLDGALRLADLLGLAAGVVGTTIIAVGTSLPELVTVVQSSRRGEPDLIVGNLLGSNIFNSLAVGGVTGLIGNAAVGDTTVTTTAVVAMLVMTALALVALVTGRRVRRLEGLGLVAAYAVVVALLY
jgi:cation:H+ antiporter